MYDRFVSDGIWNFCVMCAYHAEKNSTFDIYPSQCFSREICFFLVNLLWLFYIMIYFEWEVL